MSLRDSLARITGQDLAEEAANQACEACGESGLVAFYEATAVPSQTCVLLDTGQEAASYPSGDLLLGFCPACGFIQNTRFDQNLVDYSVPTEESQAFSPKFNEFANWLADQLVDRYQLSGKSVLEIGCGKGDFLLLLAERGIAHGVGIDPGYLPERLATPETEVEFVRDWYGPESSTRTGDLVLTRHLMEHVPNVTEFFGWLRESTAATTGSALYTEVPDVERVLVEGAFWDVYYEHCSYFSQDSLARTLKGAGFEVQWVERGFDDQYLLAGAVPSARRARRYEDSVERMGSLVESFAIKAEAGRKQWREAIERVVAGGGSVAVWGGGSKAVAFLASIAASGLTVVDINPFKQGKWLPGVSVRVQPPETLLDNPPDLVIPMNPIYVDEIKRDLEQMGLSPEIRAV